MATSRTCTLFELLSISSAMEWKFENKNSVNEWNWPLPLERNVAHNRREIGLKVYNDSNKVKLNSQNSANKWWVFFWNMIQKETIVNNDLFV